MGWFSRTEPDPVQVYVDLGLGGTVPEASGALTREIKSMVYNQLGRRFAANILERDFEGLWHHIPRFPIDFSFQIT